MYGGGDGRAVRPGGGNILVEVAGEAARDQVVIALVDGRAGDEDARALDLTVLDRMTAALKAVGFLYVTLDMQGYRSGSMNDVLPVSAISSAV